MNRLRYLEGVTTLALNDEKCVGCGMCSKVCPHGVFGMADKKAFVADAGGCMECGACAMNCPAGAVSVVAGVGCAGAIINSMLGRKGDSCCCVVETRQL